MSVITDTWRHLVRRRLWPVAVLLLGAVVAVPVLLAKSPSTPPPAPVPASADENSTPAGGGLGSQPVVAMADTSSRGRRHVLGPRKDPFAPAPQAIPKPTPTPSTTSTTTISTPHFGGSTAPQPGGSTTPIVPSTPVNSGGGSTFPPPVSTSPLPSTPVPTTPTTPSTPKPRLAPGTLIVRFGDATTDSLPSLHVKELDALPDVDTPVAIYLGPGRSKHSAQFLLDASVKPEGDGSCRPSPADCQTVELREGDTEFLEVSADAATGTTAAQYELDLVKVGVKPSKQAKSSKAHHARDSHARAARVGVTIARVVRLLHP